MANFDACLAYVLGHEGGLSENPSDPGGITMNGISLRFLREVHVDDLKRAGIFSEVNEDTIRNLTPDQVSKLYYSEFWVKAPFDNIMNGMIGKYIFDMAINVGLHQATLIVQRACCCAQKKQDYIKDDGLFGKSTLAAVNYASFMLIPALIAERTGYYRLLVAQNSKNEAFIEGWLKRAFDI